MSRNENGQLEPGTLLAGRYRIERFLAGGGMGLVYIAQDQRLLNRRCAIKEMFDRFTNPEERTRAIEYFQREADTLSQLQHPAIPAIVDRFGEGNCHYLVMDFIEGTNLEEELATQGGILPESQVVEIARQLCDVFSYLHSFRPPVIYRDMKPGNVILAPDGRAKLIDFGIARIFTPQGKATLIGTPGFAPPEQYSGKVDERSDLYGLGATLHYLLTSRDPEKNPPFSFPPVHTIKPDASPFLAQAIDRALAYKPEERPASAEALKEMFLYGRGLNATRDSGSTSRAATQVLESLTAPVVVEEVSSPRQPHRWRRKIAALLLFGVLAGSAYGVYTHSEVIGPDFLARVGEQIPWQQIEAVLPESAQPRFREFVANLPWEREKRLRVLRADPIEVASLKVLNTSRDGTPLPEQKTTYTVSEVQYLTWEADLKNRLASVEEGTYRLEGRFFDPEGKPAGESAAGRVVKPEEQELTLRGITLLEGLKEREKGDYHLEVYLGDRKLASQTIRIEADPKPVVKEDKPAAPVAVADARPPTVTSPPAFSLPPDDSKRLTEEAKRMALIQERSKKPLELAMVRFVNTNKDGARLSEPGDSFALSQVRFVAWTAVFRNRLQGLVPAYHRVSANYYAPNGQFLGTVEDAKEVAVEMKDVNFTARLGNSSGGAFVPGTYRVDFYVNGYPLSSKQFSIANDHEIVATVPHDTGSGSNKGSIIGLVSGREVAIELTFRTSADGTLEGDLMIYEPGYGPSPLQGHVNGTHMEFTSRIKGQVFQFRGWREGERLSGVYKVPSLDTGGRWSVRMSGGS